MVQKTNNTATELSHSLSHNSPEYHKALHFTWALRSYKIKITTAGAGIGYCIVSSRKLKDAETACKCDCETMMECDLL